MDDSDDGIRNLALGVVALATVIAVGVALAVAVGQRSERPVPTTVVSDAETIRFETGASTLSAEAAERLAQIGETLRAGQAEAVFVTPVFAEPAQAPLALQRALAVRHALESNGVPAARVVVNAPQRRKGHAEAVEVQLR